MEEINEIQSYIVNGYVFETKTEYNEAVQEKKAINLPPDIIRGLNFIVYDGLLRYGNGSARTPFI